MKKEASEYADSWEGEKLTEAEMERLFVGSVRAARSVW